MTELCKSDLPVVSVVIPCRNEGKFISECLDSILGQTYKKDRIQIVVVDGMSDDGTRDIIVGYSRNHACISLIDNPNKITPAALNIGIKYARGDYVLILSSHSKISRYFIENIVSNYSKYEADCVGGVIETIPENNSVIARCISFAMTHPFGVGNSYFRIGLKKPRYVDTVPFGCYRRDVFNTIGMFDEELLRNQDDELNLRLLKNKGKVLLVPDIISYYYARASLKKLWKMFYQYGYFKPLVAKKVGAVLTWRQLIPPILVGSLGISSLYYLYQPSQWEYVSLILGVYFASNTLFSLQIAIKRGIRYFPVLPMVFAVMHFSYGIGYLKGVWDFIIANTFKRKKIEDIPITR